MSGARFPEARQATDIVCERSGPAAPRLSARLPERLLGSAPTNVRGRHRRTRLIVVTLLLVAPVMDAQPPRPAERYRVLRHADSLLAAGDSVSALPLLEQLVRDDEWNGDVWLKYGQVARKIGLDSVALLAFDKAYQLGVSSTVFWKPATAYTLAQQYAKLGNRQLTEEWIQRALDARFTYRGGFLRDSAFSRYWSDPEFRRIGFPFGECTDRDESWRRDISFLAAEAQRVLSNPVRVAESSAFRQSAESLKRRVPDLTDTALLVELRRMIALLSDGHAGVFRMGSEPVLPVRLYMFSDGLFVVDAEHPYRELVGRRVTSIGGVSTAEAMSRVASIVPADNPMDVLAKSPVYLRYLIVLQALGLAGDTLSTVLGVDDAHDARTITVRAVDRGSRKIWDPIPATKPVPLWLENQSTPYWLRSLPRRNAVYWQFNQVQDKTGQNLEQFATQLRDTLRATKARNLIIDVRQNDGGRSFKLPPVIRAIIAFQESSPDHETFVLIGRSTFSATQTFVSALDVLTNAIFVGEPTGSRPNFAGEGGFMLLPCHPDLRANVSSAYHQGTMWEDHRLWIAPDVPVSLSSADYFAGRDPVLNAVLDIIGAQ